MMLLFFGTYSVLHLYFSDLLTVAYFGLSEHPVSASFVGLLLRPAKRQSPIQQWPTRKQHQWSVS